MLSTETGVKSHSLTENYYITLIFCSHNLILFLEYIWVATFLFGKLWSESTDKITSTILWIRLSKREKDKREETRKFELVSNNTEPIFWFISDNWLRISMPNVWDMMCAVFFKYIHLLMGTYLKHRNIQDHWIYIVSWFCCILKLKNINCQVITQGPSIMHIHRNMLWYNFNVITSYRNLLTSNCLVVANEDYYSVSGKAGDFQRGVISFHFLKCTKVIYFLD